jgi:hypothetical protein
MDVDVMLPVAGLALVVVLDLLVAAAAVFASGRRGRSRRLVALCALLLGLVPPLNVVYLAAISLLPVGSGR